MGIFSGIKDFFDSVPIVGDVIGLAGDLIGGQQERKQQTKMFDKNLSMQREFAKHGIRWRVEDAKAAGLHPLVGAGIQPTSFSPQYVGGAGSTAKALGRFGHNLSRSIAATQTKEERLNAESNRRLADAKARNLDWHSKVMEDTLNKRNSPNPPLPGGAGFLPSTSSKVIPTQKEASQPGTQGVTAGIGHAGKMDIFPGGKMVFWPSKENQELVESFTPARWDFYQHDLMSRATNQLNHYLKIPKFRALLMRNKSLFDSFLDKGYEARWNYKDWSWRKVKIGPEGRKLFYHWKDREKASRKQRKFWKTYGNIPAF
jgi:hypothetical protein